MVSAAYVLITFWQYRNACATAPGLGCYNVRDPPDLARSLRRRLAPASASCGGTPPRRRSSWRHRSPALAASSSVCPSPVAPRCWLWCWARCSSREVTSVVIQIIAFRSTGRRVFRMARSITTSELVGWAETTVIIRFWLLTAIACGSGCRCFYSEWLHAIGDQPCRITRRRPAAGPVGTHPGRPRPGCRRRVTGRAIVAALAGWDVEVWVLRRRPAAARRLADARALNPTDAIVRAADFDPVVTSPGSRRPIWCWPRPPPPACRSGVTSSSRGASTPRAATVRRGAGWW